MSSAAILLPNENLVFRDVAKALQLSFMELGWDAMWLSDKDHIREYHKEIDVAIVLTPFDYRDIDRLLPKATRILWQLEQLPWPTRIHEKRRKHFGWDELRKIRLKYDYVFDCDIGNIEQHWRFFAKKQTIAHLPIGYSSVFELDKNIKPASNKVTFIGSVRPAFCQRHRKKVIKILQRQLGDKFGIIQNRYGDRARQAVKKSTINLNVHQYLPLSLMESLRLIALLFSNKCFVISEPFYNNGPFEHLEHLVFASHRDMVSEIKYYLDTPWERERMASNAYEFVKKHYTMTQHLEKALAIL